MNVVCLALVWISSWARVVPQQIEFPAENPPDPEKALLGKFLFWEEQMSGDNTTACGTCHLPEAGGSDPRSFDPDSVHPGFDGLFATADDVRGSKGVVSFDRPSARLVFEPLFFPGPLVTGRRAPTVLNVGLATAFGNDAPLFWDGRAKPEFVDPQTGQVAIVAFGSLESQAVEPFVSSVEMGGSGQTWDAITTKLTTVRPLALATNLPADMIAFLGTHPTYPEMFATVFGTPVIDARRIAFAIADYERTLMSLETPLDLHFAFIQPLPPRLEPGLDVFMGACHQCHIAPFTMDWDFHDTGVTPEGQDPGLALVTGLPEDRGKFKTPQLRDLSLRAPYFHDGSAATLGEVVDFYARGGNFGNARKEITPLFFSLQQKADLELFLEEALTDPRVPAGLPPFDRPTLGSEIRGPAPTFGAGTPTAGGVEPRVLAHVPPNRGHDTFMIGTNDAPLGSLAVFVLSPLAVPGGSLLGLSFNVSFVPRFALWAEPTDPNGVASIGFRIPDDPGLQGVSVYGNWLFLTSSFAGLASTAGVEIRVL